MKRILVLAFFVLVAAGSASAAGDLAGRDYVELGKLGTLAGTLLERDGEWYLAASGLEYAVHLGNYAVIYPEGIALKSGSTATVRGFIHEDQVSAVSVTSDGKTWSFRDDDGRPLWAGRGKGRNSVAGG